MGLRLYTCVMSRVHVYEVEGVSNYTRTHTSVEHCLESNVTFSVVDMHEQDFTSF